MILISSIVINIFIIGAAFFAMNSSSLDHDIAAGDTYPKTTTSAAKQTTTSTVTYSLYADTLSNQAPETETDITTTTLPETTVPETTVTTTTAPETTTETTTTTTTPTETTPAETEPAEDENVEYITYYYYGEWLWIGDSRTVGMSQCISMDSFAKSAMGLNWFLENSEEIYKYRYKTIVINLGINDLGNIYNYLDTFNNMPHEFIENNCIYIMAINPVDEAKEPSYGYSTRNSSIENFNNIMRDNLRNDFFFIDTYSYLTNTGFGTTDGLHYDYNTYVNIYNYVVSTITGT